MVVHAAITRAFMALVLDSFPSAQAGVALDVPMVHAEAVLMMALTVDAPMTCAGADLTALEVNAPMKSAGADTLAMAAVNTLMMAHMSR